MEKKIEAKSNTGTDSFRIFEDFYHKYKNMYFNYILKFTNNYDTAEDLLQESFIKIADKFHTLKDPSKFKSWGFQIVANTCRDWYKKVKREKVVYTENIENFEEKHDPVEEETSTGEVKKMIDGILGSFLPDEKEIFILKQYERMNYEEIAGALNLSKRTVRRRMKSAVVKVKAELTRMNFAAG